MKKEKNISQTFCSMQNGLELQFLVDGLVDFLKFIIWYVDRGLGHGKNVLLDTYLSFFLKN